MNTTHRARPRIRCIQGLRHLEPPPYLRHPELWWRHGDRLRVFGRILPVYRRPGLPIAIVVARYPFRKAGVPWLSRALVPTCLHY